MQKFSGIGELGAFPRFLFGFLEAFKSVAGAILWTHLRKKGEKMTLFRRPQRL